MGHSGDDAVEQMATTTEIAHRFFVTGATRQESRDPDPGQAQPPRPGAGGRLCLRGRAGPAAAVRPLSSQPDRWSPGRPERSRNLQPGRAWQMRWFRSLSACRTASCVLRPARRPARRSRSPNPLTTCESTWPSELSDWRCRPSMNLPELVLRGASRRRRRRSQARAGAGGRVRTDDLPLTRRLRYHCATPAGAYGDQRRGRVPGPAGDRVWVPTGRVRNRYVVRRRDVLAWASRRRPAGLPHPPEVGSSALLRLEFRRAGDGRSPRG